MRENERSGCGLSLARRDSRRRNTGRRAGCRRRGCITIHWALQRDKGGPSNRRQKPRVTRFVQTNAERVEQGSVVPMIRGASFVSLEKGRWVPRRPARV